jgi:hypothetical protein
VNKNSTPGNVGKLRAIVFGSTGPRYTTKNTPLSKLKKVNNTAGIRLRNETSHPIEFTPFASGCRVASKGELLEDKGIDNRVTGLD